MSIIGLRGPQNVNHLRCTHRHCVETGKLNTIPRQLVYVRSVNAMVMKSHIIPT